MKRAKVQYKPVQTMGWHPAFASGANTEADYIEYAQSLAARHPEVRVVNATGKCIWLYAKGEGIFRNPELRRIDGQWRYVEAEG